MSNKENALTFLQRAAFGSVDEAFAMVTPGFRHHNPHFAAGAEALKAAMAESAAKSPDRQLEVQRVLEDGDYVAVHSRIRQQREQHGASVVHIFRFEDGKIAELWDIAMEGPARSPNSDGLF